VQEWGLDFKITSPNYYTPKYSGPPKFSMPIISSKTQNSTNESIEAIIIGLDVQSGDKILAIGGSGDQAFAMIGKGAIITTVDSDEDQLNFMFRRLNQIQNGDYEKFMSNREWKGIRNQPYFSESFFQNIHSNTNNISIIQGNIFEIAEKNESQFDKVYLSNAPTYEIGFPHYQEVRKRIARGATGLKIGGLLYFSENYGWAISSQEFVREGLNFLKKESQRARKLETENKSNFGWIPYVFKKGETEL